MLMETLKAVDVTLTKISGGGNPLFIHYSYTWDKQQKQKYKLFNNNR